MEDHEVQVLVQKHPKDTGEILGLGDGAVPVPFSVPTAKTQSQCIAIASSHAWQKQS